VTIVVFTLLASLLATPLGWGTVDGTHHQCDRMQIYNTQTDVRWVICANKIYQYDVIKGKRQPPVDKTLQR